MHKVIYFKKRGKRMKRVIKNNLLGFILGAIIFGSIGVYASSYIAKDISFTPKDSAWKKSNGEDITTVKDALDDLYENRSNIELFTNLVSFSSSSNGNQLVSLENLNKGNYVCNHLLSSSWVSGTANYTSNNTLAVEYEINGCDNLDIIKQDAKAQGAKTNVGDIYSVISNRFTYFNCRLDENGSISVKTKHTGSDTVPDSSSLSCYKIG